MAKLWIEVLQNWSAYLLSFFLARGKYEGIERKFKTEKPRLIWRKHTYPIVCQIIFLWFLDFFSVLLRIYELFEQSRESFDTNIDEESNHFQEIPEEIYEDSDGIKGQLIREWLCGGFNFPKNPQKIWLISALESKKWSNQKEKKHFIMLCYITPFH